MKKIKSYKSVWDALEETPEAAANMKVRSSLMIELIRLIERRGLTQAEAAELFGVSQPRVSDLMRGKIGLFSVDCLLNMAARAEMSPVLRLVKFKPTASAGHLKRKQPLPA